MLFRFQSNLDFLVNFHQSLESIASMDDNFHEMVEMAGSISRTNQAATGLSSDGKPQPPKTIFAMLKHNGQFIPEILQNILNFKFMAMFYAQKMFDLIGILLQANAYEDQEDQNEKIELISPVNLGLLFIQFSSSSVLIQKAKKMVFDQIQKGLLPISPEIFENFKDCRLAPSFKKGLS